MWCCRKNGNYIFETSGQCCSWSPCICLPFRRSTDNASGHFICHFLFYFFPVGVGPLPRTRRPFWILQAVGCYRWYSFACGVLVFRYNFLSNKTFKAYPNRNKTQNQLIAWFNLIISKLNTLDLIVFFVGKVLPFASFKFICL